MVEFIEEKPRHMCRNPRCRSKLPTPVTNEREAFCARGCHSSFYRNRCLVCEQPMERKTGNQLVCGKRKCRNGLQTRADLGRYHGSISAKLMQEVPDSIDSKQLLKPDRGIDWAIAVNHARIRAPRRVLDAVFARVPLMLDGGGI
jgi:hypothetical protein